MKFILPFIVSYAVRHFFVLMIANQEDIIEVIENCLLQIFYFLSCKDPVIYCRFYIEDLFEENIEILLCILDRLDSDVKTELFSFSL